MICERNQITTLPMGFIIELQKATKNISEKRFKLNAFSYLPIIFPYICNYQNECIPSRLRNFIDFFTSNVHVHGTVYIYIETVNGKLLFKRMNHSTVEAAFFATNG